MPLADQLYQCGQFTDVCQEDEFIDTMKLMVADPRPEYIKAMLAHLDDDSEFSDIQKIIIGMAECFPKAVYYSTLIHMVDSLNQKAADWLDYICHRITNSTDDTQIFQDVFTAHSNRNNMATYLDKFRQRHPDKKECLKFIDTL